MKKFVICLAMAVPGLLGCGSQEGGKGSDVPDRGKPAAAAVRFLIGANGIIDAAIDDGRLPAISFDKQSPDDSTITALEGADPKAGAAGLAAGTFQTYVFDVNIGSSRFRNVGIHVERPLPVTGKFQLTNIQPAGVVLISGTTTMKGGQSTMNRASYRLYTASLNPNWTGNAQNTAGPDLTRPDPPKTK